VGSYHLAKDWRFNSDAPEAEFPPPADQAEARRQDLQHLALFFELERSWSERSLASAKTAYEQLMDQAPAMTDAEFELAVARIVALAGNAHTKVREYNRTPRYSRLPIRGYWFADGYHVIRAYQGFEQLLGNRVTHIDGIAVERIKDELRQYIAGPEGTFRKYSPYLLESPELMFAAGLTKSPQRMEVTLEGFDAGTKVVVFEPPFPPSSDQIGRSHYLLTATAYAKSQPDWKTLDLNSESAPLYLQLPDERMQLRAIPELKAMYLQFWANNDVGSTSIKTFCRDALEAFRSEPTVNVIIDHRFNGGGNFNRTRDCLTDFGRSIPPDGHLYIITGGSTFSAGMYSIAFLLHSAGDQAVLVGENVGDSMQHWGEDNLLRLPNSEIEIKFSTGMHDLGKPCNDWQKCHWDALFLNMYLEDMEPDIHSPLHYRDFAGQVDPALEAIRQHQGL
tara:strand:+ start:11845 stop:13191 length:1347 start_codon:yes stop_codon:yes gene_type:complete